MPGQGGSSAAFASGIVGLEWLGGWAPVFFWCMFCANGSPTSTGKTHCILNDGVPVGVQSSEIDEIPRCLEANEEVVWVHFFTGHPPPSFGLTA